jgi:rare lipoprotein A
MKHLLTAAALSLAVYAGASLPAAASTGDERGMMSRRSDTARETSADHQRLARAGASDYYYYDEEVQPRRRSTQRHSGSSRQRYVKSRHTRSAKSARRHQRTAHRRTTGRQTAAHQRHHAAPQRAAAAPAAKPSTVAGPGSVGVASFYWQPQKLASGGWFNPNALTAAHKSLPFGSRVRVTHLGNGRSVEVKINDRGPYIAGRIIDLSKAAAGIIGMTGQGIARVKVEVLGR